MESSSKNHDNGLVENKSPTLKREVHYKDSKRESLTNSSCKERESTDDKENNCHHKGVDGEGHETAAVVPRKFFKNWKQACDRTKDRTKDLLKRWRTLPESDSIEHQGFEGETSQEKENPSHGWSVHIWSTWLTRGSGEEEDEDATPSINLSPLQQEKFTHFFSHLLDWDRDDMVSEQDFESLSERLRHFADWSTNSTEFHILQEVQQGFVNTFITSAPADSNVPSFMTGTISLEQWLAQWSKLVSGAKNLSDFPVWLQYFSKIIFLVINKSGSGAITRDELRVFYSSFLGFDTQKVGETLDVAFNSMTSNGDHLLRFPVFNLSFCNFLLGRYPHGPGQFLFGPYEGNTLYTTLFPIDYSALNSTPEKLEQYSPHKQSNRHSVIV